MNYNYLENIENDIIEYVKENKEYLQGKSIEDLYDDLFIEDSVTGNASGSYTFSTWKAEENIAHNLDILAEAMQEFGCNNVDYLEKGADWCDVTIRCYLLGQALDEVKEEVEEILNNEEE